MGEMRKENKCINDSCSNKTKLGSGYCSYCRIVASESSRNVNRFMAVYNNCPTRDTGVIVPLGLK